jgi:hypothetical protein
MPLRTVWTSTAPDVPQGPGNSRSHATPLLSWRRLAGARMSVCAQTHPKFDALGVLGSCRPRPLTGGVELSLLAFDALIQVLEWVGGARRRAQHLAPGPAPALCRPRPRRAPLARLLAASRPPGLAPYSRGLQRAAHATTPAWYSAPPELHRGDV